MAIKIIDDYTIEYMADDTDPVSELNYKHGYTNEMIDNIKTIVIKDRTDDKGWNGVPYSAFRNCKGIEKIIIDTRRDLGIGQYSFESCANLKDIEFLNFPNKATLTIVSDAFAFSGIKKLVFPDCHLYFDVRAFADMKNLEQIVFNRTKIIEQGSLKIFSNNIHLKQVDILVDKTDPEQVKNMFNTIFKSLRQFSRDNFTAEDFVIRSNSKELLDKINEHSLVFNTKYEPLLGLGDIPVFED